MGDAYPELNRACDRVTKVLKQEEERFTETLEQGLKHLKSVIANMSGKEIPGKDVFRLYDTYGFPIEMTKDLAKENGLQIDERGFEEAFKKHQELSRAGAEQKFAGGLADHSEETTKLHTATHLLHQALRMVLGNHVQQKGSNITQERLRFDFSHPEKMTTEQIAEVEKIINKVIQENLPVSWKEMSVNEAKASGALGFFEHKYGEKVKVYTIGNEENFFSREICGGPHVKNTGELKSVKIIKEEACSAGVRRIKAVVG
jgi:alanyl-tRNA synthetase